MSERGEPKRRARAPRAPANAPGLCPRCLHVKRIDSSKGSTFWLCERSKNDARFPRYPSQPRMECEGFES